MRQLSDPKIHSIATLSNQHASIEVMMYNPSLFFYFFKQAAKSTAKKTFTQMAKM